MSSEEERQDLVQRAVEGDQDAVQRLVVYYHGPLHGVVAAQMSTSLRRHVGAEDILQQAYTEAFTSIGRYTFNTPGGFYKWLETIALRRLKSVSRDLTRQKRDIRRNQSRFQDAETSIHDLIERIPGAQSSPSRRLAKQEASAAAVSSLARLEEDQRNVITMRFLEHRPVSEIAEELGKSKGAVHMLITRGLDRLEKLLGSISRYLS